MVPYNWLRSHHLARPRSPGYCKARATARDLQQWLPTKIDFFWQFSLNVHYIPDLRGQNECNWGKGDGCYLLNQNNVLHGPVACQKWLSSNVMGLWTDPTSKDGSFILTNQIAQADDFFILWDRHPKLATLRLKEIENIWWISFSRRLSPLSNGRLWGGGGGVRFSKFVEEELSITQ